MDSAELSDIVDRLNAACAGHPVARIPWLHGILHERPIPAMARREPEPAPGQRAMISPVPPRVPPPSPQSVPAGMSAPTGRQKPLAGLYGARVMEELMEGVMAESYAELVARKTAEVARIEVRAYAALDAAGQIVVGSVSRTEASARGKAPTGWRVVPVVVTAVAEPRLRMAVPVEPLER